MPVQATDNLLKLTTQIVTAHLSHNQLSDDTLPSLIQSVYRALSQVDEVEDPPTAMPLVPAVPAKKSVFPDFIVCLEDGKKLKMLKRHLHTSYGMTPHDYRTKWGLPQDYPMVAPSYAAKRSALAKSIGLGRRPSAETSEPVTVQPEDIEITIVPARRARGSKG